VKNIRQIMPNAEKQEKRPVVPFGGPRKPQAFYRQDTTSRMTRQRVQSVTLGIPEDPAEGGEGEGEGEGQDQPTISKES